MSTTMTPEELLAIADVANQITQISHDPDVAFDFEARAYDSNGDELGMIVRNGKSDSVFIPHVDDPEE